MFQRENSTDDWFHVQANRPGHTGLRVCRDRSHTLARSSVTAASSTATAGSSYRCDRGDAKRYERCAAGIDLFATDALDIVESDVLTGAVQTSCINRLDLELEGLPAFGDDFDAIFGVKRLRELGRLCSQRLRRHAAQHRKARARDDEHVGISLHVQLLLRSAEVSAGTLH